MIRQIHFMHVNDMIAAHRDDVYVVEIEGNVYEVIRVLDIAFIVEGQSPSWSACLYKRLFEKFNIFARVEERYRVTHITHPGVTPRYSSGIAMDKDGNIFLYSDTILAKIKLPEQ